MKNLTSDLYPVLSPRAPRGTAQEIGDPVCGITSLDGLCYAARGKLFYGGGKVAEMGLSEGEKQLVPFGAYLIVLPDKMWLNTVDGEFGYCETARQFQGQLSALWCKTDGTPYEGVVAWDEDYAPDNHEQHPVKDGVLYEWSEELGDWTKAVGACLKMIFPGIGEAFGEKSVVMFEQDDEFFRVIPLQGREIVIQSGGNDWIVIEGRMDRVRLEAQEAQFSIASKMPTMDFCFEHENRLWGCRYGLNNSGKFVNEIYASELGDFKSWSTGKGISTDGYVASCGTDGPWTGAVRSGGYPLFFKENYLHKVYGDYPANYQISVTECRGIKAGCHKSAVTVNEVLYYLSRSGVCAYDGSLPVCVSEALGTCRYGGGVAGRLGNKYYISMEDEEMGYSLYAYDTSRGMWHREDELQAVQMCTVGDVLYMLSADGLVTIGGESTEHRVQWSCETGVICDTEPEHKYVKSISVRMEAAPGSRVRFFAQYDSTGSWLHLGEYTGKSRDSIHIPLRIRRCDHLRLRIEGEGEAKIYSFDMMFEMGSVYR